MQPSPREPHGAHVGPQSIDETGVNRGDTGYVALGTKGTLTRMLRNVCFQGKADIGRYTGGCPVSGANQPTRMGAVTSANAHAALSAFNFSCPYVRS